MHLLVHQHHNLRCLSSRFDLLVKGLTPRPTADALLKGILQGFTRLPAHMQVSDLVKDVCRNLKKKDAAAMPEMYLRAMQAAFQRHLDDEESQESLQDFTALCTRVAQTYAGFNASATALLHIAKVRPGSLVGWSIHVLLHMRRS